ncbi:MAG TPA: hypothetical protein VF598_14755 [Hymenobacter sp.]|jgi:hypothetical protein
MEDRNKDLPLIVSEILIEMQQIRQDLQSYQAHTNKMIEGILDESRKNTEFVVYAMNKAVRVQQDQIDEHEERLQRLEAKAKQ